MPVGDIIQMQMPDYKLKLYGAAIIVNSKFAAEKPDAVAGFLRASIRGFRETIRNPTTAVEPVLRREDFAKKDVEVERLRMAIRENVVTPEVRANGFGAIDRADGRGDRPARLGYSFKARPKADAVFERRSCRRRRTAARIDVKSEPLTRTWIPSPPSTRPE